jgi:hypothetical protein
MEIERFYEAIIQWHKQIKISKWSEESDHEVIELGIHSSSQGLEEVFVVLFKGKLCLFPVSIFDSLA